MRIVIQSTHDKVFMANMDMHDSSTKIGNKFSFITAIIRYMDIRRQHCLFFTIPFYL